MGDDKTKRGKPDRDRVSANEPYEVEYLASKHGLPAEVVRDVIEQEGPMRADIEAELEKKKQTRE